MSSSQYKWLFYTARYLKRLLPQGKRLGKATSQTDLKKKEKIISLSNPLLSQDGGLRQGV